MKFSIVAPMLTAAAFALFSTPIMAAGDAAKGERIARKCKSCHTLDEGGKNGLGPNLYGILGRASGSVEGYKYSAALADGGIVWTDSMFNDFVLKPKKAVPGTKMSFKGIRKAIQREELLAYFQTLGAQTADVEMGDVQAGMEVAEKHCTVCHSFEEGGRLVFGPNLFGIAGQPAAEIEGFGYSEALAGSGLVWTDTNLVGFLADPEGFVPGTTARFPGLEAAQDKSDILAYIKSLN